jgi:hypothetical protein
MRTDRNGRANRRTSATTLRTALKRSQLDLPIQRGLQYSTSLTAFCTNSKLWGTLIFSRPMRFQVLTAASMMFRIVFWDVQPCTIMVDRRFRGAYCLHHVLPCTIIVDRRFRGTFCLHNRPDDEGSTYLWNVGRQLLYTAVHPRRQIWTFSRPVLKLR